MARENEHTPGKLMLATSNSWRRFLTVEGKSVCEPTVYSRSDPHPDLHFANGGQDGPDARRIVACWNACDGISTELLENGARQILAHSARQSPWPWRYEAPDEVHVRDAEGGRVAILSNLRGALGMSGRRDPNEVIANARLIAAAPDLLEALKAMCSAYVPPIETVRRARAAISKATGEPQ